MSDVLRLHALVLRTRVNGPGARLAIWVQGCTLRCPGCFNPDTHGDAPRFVLTVEDALRLCVEQSDIEGVTVSGGEPMQQPAALLAFARGLRRATSLSLLVFSGFTYDRVVAHPLGRAILEHLDVLVAGPYVPELACRHGLIASSNQRVHRLTSRYAESALRVDALSEVLIDRQGRIVVTGLGSVEAVLPGLRSPRGCEGGVP